ncbi:DUF5677 domain-containing protein [Polaromonas sp. A23]|uniref:DUF5677 domain-containing protein n=1 Tax=Polaromonas sp. A23 TaxID=1944133 RepID=UPI0009877185|nr:DUF5677 domain-containing protein [Polaromonas sp. A23]OOG44166.1 hypothetical protein B0B52_07265 [Polaromonas sp. A23]
MAAAPNQGDYTRSLYDSELASMERLLQASMGVSQAVGGIQTANRFIRATQLFTRLTVGSYTFVRLLPSNTLTHDRVEFWDWPSIACVARNIVETYHTFYYLIDPSLSVGEVEMRMDLMHLHLNSEKYRLYRELKPDAEILREFEIGLPKDKERLKKNAIFHKLSEGRQSELLKGRAAMHLTHAEIGESLPFIDRYFRPIYRLFSIHVHSTPMSFQAQSNERGRGDENEAERFYVTLAIQIILKYLSAAVMDMARIFPDVVARACPDALAVAREVHDATVA